MALAFLNQPYVFAFAVAAVTATLIYFYTKTTDRDPAQCNKAFFKTLVAASLAGAALTYVAAGRPSAAGAELAGGGLEPFDPVPAAPNVPAGI